MISAKHKPGPDCKKCGGNVYYISSRKCVACSISRSSAAWRARPRPAPVVEDHPVDGDIDANDIALIDQLRYRHFVPIKEIARKFEITRARVREILIETSTLKFEQRAARDGKIAPPTRGSCRST